MARKKVPSPSEAAAGSKFTADSFQNFTSAVGIGTGNQTDGSRYGFNPISRIRLQLEWAYRGSWLVGRACDCVAQDMTREGVTITSTDHPDQLQRLDKEIARLNIWAQLSDTVKWSRLYGGAVAFMMIDGQDASTPLRLETLQKGQFKGLLPMDRWLLNPSFNDLVDEYGPSFGLPRYYTTVPDMMGMPRIKIHFSRLIRLDGIRLPYWQRITENLWGISVLERLWDRLIAFDSTTTGVAQLVYKAHLRTYAVEGLRDIIAQGGAAMSGLAKQIGMIRQFQTNEGMTLMDAKDKFETHQYAFSGLDSVLIQFGDQLCGALEIPAVRLFGQSPAGFNTGEADLRNYWDSIRQQQVTTLGPGIETVYRVAYISTFGKEPPEVFDINFKPLWNLSTKEKADVAKTGTEAVIGAYEAQIIDRPTAMKELKHLSDETQFFSNIQAEDIEQAEEDPAPTPEALGLTLPEPRNEAAPPAKPANLKSVA